MVHQLYRLKEQNVLKLCMRSRDTKTILLTQLMMLHKFNSTSRFLIIFLGILTYVYEEVKQLVECLGGPTGKSGPGTTLGLRFSVGVNSAFCSPDGATSVLLSNDMVGAYSWPIDLFSICTW